MIFILACSNNNSSDEKALSKATLLSLEVSGADTLRLKYTGDDVSGCVYQNDYFFLYPVWKINALKQNTFNLNYIPRKIGKYTIVPEFNGSGVIANLFNLHKINGDSYQGISGEMNLQSVDENSIAGNFNFIAKEIRSGKNDNDYWRF